ncbi:SIR2 family NAD-dependent protein deacetylase [Oenococcus kitaharae DSM 17330]|uniref:protein acetyllysine N-acetyltransferase n=1 Tax=Oenococcus kitaharae DSM 17330 TaxID=1045004 RepID=G9WJ86_9LACO|nr:SIR2 family NAD-dependent protein deacetylase [Oenococcus kitaharae DSM 17330]OEY83222.1 NAD-dependent deacetylase [Oenococcus kitaharae]OEY84255.1 NAD-dependent deacetylase [Oenococcus kitaharae]OEY85838.1 NAD-dependent deacetylase [Oenococcus kitaharae]
MIVTKEIQELFDQAQHIVFMTGAGVSTASGIPDYRSKGGLYTTSELDRPEYLLSHTCFETEPERQYRFMKENMYFPQAKPNIIHEKMAAFAKSGRARTITQNVDGLHTRLDPTVIEFHGSLYRVYAPIDHKTVPVTDYLTSMYRKSDHALLRPDITFYEEMPQHVEQAVATVAAADLLVVVGTSFQVYPFAGLINYAQNSAVKISVNMEHINTTAPIKQIIGDATEFFSEIHLR